jgi:deoxyribodipyrimidine photo-lyase
VLVPAPSIVWLRQDLRLADQPAFAAAAAAGPVVAVYVLDDASPGRWAIGGAQRWWLHHSLASLGRDLAALGVPLVLRRGRAAAEVARLAREIGAGAVHALRHYEPWWQAAEAALAGEVGLTLHDGALLANPDAVRTGSGGRFRMFTPFWRALSQIMPPPVPVPVPAMEGLTGAIASDALEDWGLLPTRPNWATGFSIWTPGETGARRNLDAFVGRVAAYAQGRNLPSVEGSSRLSPYLHFGEISPATVWHAMAGATGDPEPFLRELGWRDFTANVIDQVPDYAEAHGRAIGDRIAWRNGRQADAEFAAWTRGRTGYPIVDAGMRQLGRPGGCTTACGWWRRAS